MASHNLIIATPSSVVEQRGNADNGADEPYLMHVIDWVYKTFGTLRRATRHSNSPQLSLRPSIGPTAFARPCRHGLG